MALGLKLAAKDRTVVATIGDGSFMYNPITQSLALSAHEELPILIVVVNNTGYTAMAREHRAFYPDGVAAEHDLFYGRMITDLDYAELVRPFGGFGQRVEDPRRPAGGARSRPRRHARRQDRDPQRHGGRLGHERGLFQKRVVVGLQRRAALGQPGAPIAIPARLPMDVFWFRRPRSAGRRRKIARPDCRSCRTSNRRYCRPGCGGRYPRNARNPWI